MRRQKSPEDDLIRYGTSDTSLGTVLVAQSAAGICAILIGDESQPLVADLTRRFPGSAVVEDPRGVSPALHAALRLAEDPAGGFEPPLDMRGTAFQTRVWAALREIPAGTTATYARIAERIGAPNATRAVAGACAANHVAIAVPCHRVVRSDGSLSGYRWGVERKRELLAREGACLRAESSHVPRLLLGRARDLGEPELDDSPDQLQR